MDGYLMFAYICWALSIGLFIFSIWFPWSGTGKPNKSVIGEIVREIALIVERSEQRELRWRIAMRNEFYSEDPQ